MSNSQTIGSIVLIGATGAGKSSVGKQLARLLDWPLVELDDLRKRWYPEFGLTPEKEAEAYGRGGLPELVYLWKPYEILSVERVMREHGKRTVITFGGGQAVYVDPHQVERARAALSSASRVILLQPFEDSSRNLDVLRKRLHEVDFVDEVADVDAFVRDFTPILQMQLQSESMAQLATEMIVTGQSSPEELARHILATNPD